jgi:hypothetical protein
MINLALSLSFLGSAIFALMLGCPQVGIFCLAGSILFGWFRWLGYE